MTDLLPTIVCLCGSTRFHEAYAKANLNETLAGRIVLSVGCHSASDAELGITPDSDTKAMLDELHLRKIDMCDEVLILNVGGYIGKSTLIELGYAREKGKRVRYLEQRPEQPASAPPQAARDGFTIREVAARWSVSPRTLERAIARGEIRATRIGRSVRIPKEELERLGTESALTKRKRKRKRT